MTLSSRPVAQQDIARICGFARHEDELYFFFPKASWPLTPEQLQDSIAQRANSTVVEREGEVVGFANFYQWEEGGVCSIGNVIVAPEQRGQGIARYLVCQMIRQAVEHYRAREVCLSCFNENVAGLLLYPQLGFVPYAIEARVGPQGQRVALIQMRLDDPAAAVSVLAAAS